MTSAEQLQAIGGAFVAGLRRILQSKLYAAAKRDVG
jgi:hypothetical protein